MIEIEPCNLQPCPIDCVVGEWSEYGICSKDCGGGIQTRVRPALTDAEHGGEPCGDLSETMECNMDACDRPCELDPDWGEWAECSKECDWGYTIRQKGVMLEGGPEGYCPEWWMEDRMQAAFCNTMDCPEDLVCASQIDLLLLLDGSGSVNWYGPGFESERSFTLDLFNMLNFGDTAAKAGVILFSWEAELVHPMSTDGASLNAAAEAIKEVATLYVVIIGDNVNMGAMKNWASYPWEEHVIKVDEFELLGQKLDLILADMCRELGCRETLTGNGQDYIG